LDQCCRSPRAGSSLGQRLFGLRLFGAGERQDEVGHFAGLYGSSEDELRIGVPYVRDSNRCVRLAGIRKGMVVLNPLAGICSTLSACREVGGIKGIGIEIDAAYCREARRKLGLK